MDREPLGLVLDTDIGTDVDDLLALALILGSPELALRGVATVYGDVLLRARIVRRALTTAASPPLPVVPGRGTPRSGKEVWWAGHEGRLMPDLEREAVDEDLDAVGLIAGSPLVVAIGPLTNVAEAVETAGHGIRRIVLMGGNLARGGRAEHNLASDVDAAAAVLASGVPVAMIGLDQTERARLGPAELGRIAAAGPVGDLLALEVRQYWDSLGHAWSTPHDPLAVLLLARPDLFRLERGRVLLDATGVSRFQPDPDGPHEVVVDLDARAAVAALVDRIASAGHRNPIRGCDRSTLSSP